MRVIVGLDIRKPRSVWNFSPDRNHILRFGVYKVDGFLDLGGVVSHHDKEGDPVCSARLLCAGFGPLGG